MPVFSIAIGHQWDKSQASLPCIPKPLHNRIIPVSHSHKMLSDNALRAVNVLGVFDFYLHNHLILVALERADTERKLDDAAVSVGACRNLVREMLTQPEGLLRCRRYAARCEPPTTWFEEVDLENQPNRNSKLDDPPSPISTLRSAETRQALADRYVLATFSI